MFFPPLLAYSGSLYLSWDNPPYTLSTTKEQSGLHSAYARDDSRHQPAPFQRHNIPHLRWVRLGIWTKPNFTLLFLVHEGSRSTILSSLLFSSLPLGLVLNAFDVVDQPDWNGIMIARRPQSIRRDTRGQVGEVYRIEWEYGILDVILDGEIGRLDRHLIGLD